MGFTAFKDSRLPKRVESALYNTKKKILFPPSPELFRLVKTKASHGLLEQVVSPEQVTLLHTAALFAAKYVLRGL